MLLHRGTAFVKIGIIPILIFPSTESWVRVTPLTCLTFSIAALSSFMHMPIELLKEDVTYGMVQITLEHNLLPFPYPPFWDVKSLDDSGAGWFVQLEVSLIVLTNQPRSSTVP